mmetsp:Transcript_15965/g.50039  ORF Transcript_15965/g.50039 Transcript_15965/m.50039 type:complete len:322 (-) Transcript_15965:160-1125(-)
MAQRGGGRAVPPESALQEGEPSRDAERARRLPRVRRPEACLQLLALDALPRTGRRRSDRGRASLASSQTLPPGLRRDQGPRRDGRRRGLLRRPPHRLRRAASGLRPERQSLSAQPPRERRKRPTSRLRRRQQPHLLHPRRQLLPRSHHRRARPRPGLARPRQVLHRHRRPDPPRRTPVPQLLGRTRHRHRRRRLRPHHPQDPPRALVPHARRDARRAPRRPPPHQVQAQSVQRQGPHHASLVRHQECRTRPSLRAHHSLSRGLDRDHRLVPGKLAPHLRPRHLGPLRHRQPVAAQNRHSSRLRPRRRPQTSDRPNVFRPQD